MTRAALHRIEQPLRRARFGIWTTALTYGLSVLAGALLVHVGHRPSLSFRDKLVGTAQRESVILRQLRQGSPYGAAALDASANALGGLFSMVAGYCPPAGYGVAAYRGWIGGIVSVDSAHRSRLATPNGAAYLIVTLLLQLIPYSLASGAGVNLGFASFLSAARTGYHSPRLPWLNLPYQAVRDAGWIYLMALPLFAIASLFEFLM